MWTFECLNISNPNVEIWTSQMSEILLIQMWKYEILLIQMWRNCHLSIFLKYLTFPQLPVSPLTVVQTVVLQHMSRGSMMSPGDDRKGAPVRKPQTLWPVVWRMYDCTADYFSQDLRSRDWWLGLTPLCMSVVSPFSNLTWNTCTESYVLFLRILLAWPLLYVTCKPHTPNTESYAWSPFSNLTWNIKYQILRIIST